ncbi:50S ribosomal protein L6 [Candidatus Pacearchaeota archaeon]|nr:50S ribosomal protein L6 [Candidatus Pacearchaeota archaeon]
MKKEIFQEIEIPNNVKVDILGNLITVIGKEGENKRKFDFTGIETNKEENKIIIGNKKSTKNEKKRINSIAAHIRNMVGGVQKKYEYDLKICFSHFPFTVEISGNEAKIKNFLGEKVPRVLKLNAGVEIKADKEMIKVLSVDKELAGQTAADLETVTKIRGRDRRVFQDGLFITSKPGEEEL